MITIEVVENPGFFEQYGDWLYLGLIAAVLTVFFWRRQHQVRAKQSSVNQGIPKP
ncbi:MAG: hypothetical protein AB1439_03125 [candidate division FCPU426 bacterium]